jgi:hypothetical protein
MSPDAFARQPSGDPTVRQINYYVSAYTDEVIPCPPTLDAWAAWLSSPPCPNCEAFGREGPARDGDIFEGFTLIVLGEVRAEHLGGQWRAVDPIPEGTEVYFQREVAGETGWSAEAAETSSDVLDLAAGDADPHGGPLIFACVKEGPPFVATLRIDDDGPRLDLERVQ